MFDDVLEVLRNPTALKIAKSAILIAVVFAVRTFLTVTVLRLSPQSEQRRRWVVNIRNTSILAIVLGLAALWAEAVETFGTVVLALGVGFVIATKELLMCATGSFLRAAANTYSVGDRIEIGHFRGDVIDLNLFTTTLLEVGPGPNLHLRTGRTIVFPNSKLLGDVVVNESFMKQFVIHVFNVPMKIDDDWHKAEEALLRSAETECAPFLEEARNYMDRLERSHGLQGLPVQPRALLQLTDADKATIVMRVPAPVGRQGAIEQAIVRRYLGAGG
ncbi:MAG: mechanosensitive ion channel family protein [Bryobacterales bacterium]